MTMLIIPTSGMQREFSSRLAGRGLLSITLSLLLSSCCIFGFETRSTYEWQAPLPENTQHLKRWCEIEEESQADLEKKRFEAMLAKECAKTEPFASVEFVNPSTGANYGPSFAESTAEALCPNWLQNKTVSEGNLWRYCRRCFISQNENRMCFEKNGLRKVKVQTIACKPMRLF